MNPLLFLISDGLSFELTADWPLSIALLIRLRLFLILLWEPLITSFLAICKPSLGSTTIQLFKLLKYLITFLAKSEVPYSLRCNPLEFKSRGWMLCFISAQCRRLSMYFVTETPTIIVVDFFSHRFLALLCSLSYYFFVVISTCKFFLAISFIIKSIKLVACVHIPGSRRYWLSWRITSALYSTLRFNLLHFSVSELNPTSTSELSLSGWSSGLLSQ